MVSRECVICGTTVWRKSNSDFNRSKTGPYCSEKCLSVRRKMPKKEKVTKPCIICGTPVTRIPSHMLENACCSKACTEKYRKQRASKMAKELNPTKMTPEVRAKLRKARLGKGEGKSYEKTYGRHTHRVVAEEKLGRKLKPGEIVHHIDGNKRNNHPDNIQVLPSQAEHARIHMIERWEEKRK